MSKNILITGITGFFGRNFVKYLENEDPNAVIVGTAHSELKLSFFKKFHPKIKIYVVELSSEHVEQTFDKIIKDHSINYIVHSASMKHVDICQENPLIAYKVNSIAPKKIAEIAKKNNVNNVIALGSIKSNHPCSTYGILNKIMQDDMIDYGYSVYQCVNLFWSDGSVLDVWHNQLKKNHPITIRNTNHIRYFTTVEYVCNDIYCNLDAENKILTPDQVIAIRIGDLLTAFKKCFSYDNVSEIEKYEHERTLEYISDSTKNVVVTDIDDIMELITAYVGNA